MRESLAKRPYTLLHGLKSVAAISPPYRSGHGAREGGRLVRALFGIVIGGCEGRGG